MIRGLVTTILLLALSPAGSVVVTAVVAGSAAADAGIRAGDRIERFAFAGRAGDLSHPFALATAESLAAALGSATLRLNRGGERIEVVLARVPWGIRARPDLDAAAEGEYEAMRAAPPDAALATRVRATAERWSGAGRPADALWLLLELAPPLAAVGPEPALALLASAAPLEERVEQALAARAAEARAEVLERLGRREAAQAARELAVERHREADETLLVAMNLSRLALLARRHSLSDTARYATEAAAILDAEAPDSVARAEATLSLATVTAIRGDLEGGRDLLLDALEILERKAPEHEAVSGIANNLGIVYRRLGDFTAAEQSYLRALAIRERQDPDGLMVAQTLNNLGVVAKNRGDLAAAERYYRRALQIKRRVEAPEAELVAAMGNLVNVAYERWDLAAAERQQRQVLEMAVRSTPDGEIAATAWVGLGQILRDRGALDDAIEAFEHARAAYQRLSPDGARAGFALAGLGEAYELKEDLTRARAAHEQAHRIRRAAAPVSLDTADSLFALARVAHAEDDLAAALAALEPALAIQSRLAPGSTTEAEMLNLKGRLLASLGNAEQALSHLRRAVDALEEQLRRLGGSDVVQAGFRSRFERIYKDYAEHLLDTGDDAGALEAIERYRGQQLRIALAQRAMRLDANLPAELAAEQAALNRRRDRLYGGLERAAGDAARIDAALLELEQLRGERTRLIERIRAVDPALAALRHPAPFVPAALQQVMGSEAVVSYVMFPDHLMTWVIDAERISGHRVAVSRQVLSDAVAAFRTRIQEQRDPVDVAARLHGWLVAPIEARISSVSRLVLIPDRALHLLPFAALGGDGAALVETYELIYAASLSSYAEAYRTDAPVGTGLIVGFADPGDPSDAQRAELRGPLPGPLPYSRAEVQALAAGFENRSRLYFGPEATEEAAKALADPMTALHFATHAVINPTRPLDSYLLLAQPQHEGGENGLLQAWEIFEQLRLDADLVTLSACSTGLGAVLGGEGVYGLSRAFQYAGARNVMASLWNVSDRSTAALMIRFYGHLADGRSAAAALREAQLELRRAPVAVGHGRGIGATLRRWIGRQRTIDARHPFHWAAFQLVGSGG